jgi:hypothetical protein
MMPPIPNPEGLPPEALTLEYILDEGCLPYILGQKTERAAMEGLRLTHHNPPSFGLSLPPPPMWRGSYPGLSNVVVGRTICSLNIRGGNIASYRVAAQRALHHRLGPSVGHEADQGYRSVLPGQITGCQNGVRYSYYQQGDRPFFSVELNRVADCAKDPMRNLDTPPPRG